MRPHTGHGHLGVSAPARMRKALAVTMLLLLGLIAPGAVDLAQAAPDPPQNVYPDEHTWANPSNSYWPEDRLSVTGDRNAYLSFDLNGISGPFVSATLVLTVKNSTSASATHTVNRIDDFDEVTIRAGQEGNVGADLDDVAIGGIAAGQTVSFDVTAAVTEPDRYSFRVSSDMSAWMNYHSVDNVAQADRPRLVIVTDLCADRTNALTISGQQTSNPQLNGDDDTAIDATDAYWPGFDGNADPLPWMVTVRNSDDICWSGGVLATIWNERQETWQDTYHSAGGLTLENTPNAVVDGIQIIGQGDGIHITWDSDDVLLHGVWLEDIHDDCVENDWLHDLTIEDSFFDGCYVFLSAQTFGGQQNPPGVGSSNVILIRDSVIRLEPQPSVHSGPRWGTGPLWKWDPQAPTLEIHDTVIRVDQESTVNNSTVAFPDDMVVGNCSNNTIVWLGDGPFPGDPNDVPSCFTITTDANVYHDAVTAWQDRHPDR